MTLDDYQSAARRTVNPALSDRDRMLDAAAGLAEEAGEVLGIVRKHLLQQRPFERERLVHELGDVLWCLATVAGEVGVKLGDVAARNLEMLRQRYPDGFSAEAARARRDTN